MADTYDDNHLNKLQEESVRKNATRSWDYLEKPKPEIKNAKKEMSSFRKKLIKTANVVSFCSKAFAFAATLHFSGVTNDIAKTYQETITDTKTAPTEQAPKSSLRPVARP